MATPTKPIRIPPTMSEEDRHYLEIKRNNQNNVYQLTVLFIELLRNKLTLLILLSISGIKHINLILSFIVK